MKIQCPMGNKKINRRNYLEETRKNNVTIPNIQTIPKIQIFVIKLEKMNTEK